MLHSQQIPPSGRGKSKKNNAFCLFSYPPSRSSGSFAPSVTNRRRMFCKMVSIYWVGSTKVQYPDYLKIKIKEKLKRAKEKSPILNKSFIAKSASRIIK